MALMSNFFPGFEQRTIDVGDAQLHVRVGGEGPPLLLLYGFPQTHVHWHAVAPLLKADFRLIIPDLRGYGQSVGPAPDPHHVNYSKRTMAQDMITLMAQLGFRRFFLAGHDRGARVAYRLALDHPEAVMRLASLDTVPTIDIWEAMDMEGSLDAFHWPLLAQPAPIPERLIGAEPDLFIQHLLERWVGRPNVLSETAVSHYIEQFRKPSVQRAMIEDYRAGATIDYLHDQADRAAGKKVMCPVFVPWGSRYTMSSPLPVWQRWADDVCELALDCGHFIAEEMPEACATALRHFFLQD